MCQIPLAPAAVLQTAQPLGMGGNDFGMTLTCPFGADSNVSDSKSEKETNQGKREKTQPAFQEVSLFWLSRNSGELTDHLNCLKAPAVLFSGVLKIAPKLERKCRGPHLFWLVHDPVIIKCSSQEHCLEQSKEEECAVTGNAEISPKWHSSWSWKQRSESHYHFRYLSYIPPQGSEDFFQNSFVNWDPLS